MKTLKEYKMFIDGSWVESSIIDILVIFGLLNIGLEMNGSEI